MWIENVSYADIEKGYHYDAGPNSMLIQIVDGGLAFPVPKYPFKEIRQYVFMDVEPTDQHWDEFKELAITVPQAKAIGEDLKFALANDMNVVVHCVAGLCRSGAVTEVGVMLGFQDTEKYRQPNVFVKQRILRTLGMGLLD